MTSKISENICMLRKKYNLTQQKLGELLGVSIAAISKWETGIAHPDIELLPALAQVFDVSIDYFFDFHLGLSVKNNRKTVLDNAKEAFASGKQKEAISALTEVLIRYPNDFILKFNRAQMMVYTASKPPLDTEKSHILNEANKELIEIVNSNENKEIIDESYYLLSMSYLNLGLFEKAIDTIHQIKTSNRVNIGIALLQIYMKQGDINNAMKQFEFNIYLSLCNIYANSIWIDELFINDFEKSLQFYNMAIATFKAYSGNNPSRFDVYTSIFYEKTAFIHANRGEYENAVNALRFAAEYAQSFDNIQENNDLPIFDKLDAKDTEWNAIQNQKSHLLHLVESKYKDGYEVLGESGDFAKIIQSLKII